MHVNFMQINYELPCMLPCDKNSCIQAADAAVTERALPLVTLVFQAYYNTEP